jgi:tyrosine-protein kinase Etk/Wzc
MSLMREDRADLGLQVAEPSPVLASSEERETDFLDRFIVLAERKIFILKFVGAAAVLSTILAFLLPIYYTANTKLMPPQQSQSSASAMLNQLGALGVLAGNQLGLRNASDLYVDVLRSRTVADDLIQRFSLMQVYHKKRIKDVRKRLQDLTEITASQKDGVISLTVDDRDPQRAADLANAYVEELQKLTQTLAVTEAGRRRLFFEKEVQKAREELADAEVALKSTQEATGLYQLDSQSRAMIEAMITLHSMAVAKEAQVQAMRAFATSENPDLIRAEKELAAVQAQVARLERGQGSGSMADLPVSKVPSAGLEYIRRLREVKYREALVEILTKQYEIARIDEAKDATIIQVLDKGVRPLEKSSPPRGLIVVLATLTAFFVAVPFVLFRESWKRTKDEDPRQAAQLQRLKFALRIRGNS